MTGVAVVEFHTGVADRLGYACRLLRKAYRQGVRVQVTAAPADLAALDQALWTLDERDFIPHVRWPVASTGMAARTPLWLATHALTEGAPPVLVNLGAEVPPRPDTLERIIEIVGNETEDVLGGRARWRAYKAAGLNPKHVGDEHGGA